jgi:glutamate dehydrogenase
VVCREVFGLPDYVAAVEALDNEIDTGVQTELYLEFRRLLDRAVRWFLQSRPGDLDVAAEIDRFAPTVQRLRTSMPELLVGSERKRLRSRIAQLEGAGVPPDTAVLSAGLLDAFSLLDVAELAQTTGTSADDVVALYFTLSERYGVDTMLSRIAQLDRTDRWQALARGALRDDLYAALESLTLAVLTHSDADETDKRIAQWEKANASQLARARQTLDEVRSLEQGDLASLSVALRMLRGVVRSGTAAS